MTLSMRVKSLMLVQIGSHVCPASAAAAGVADVDDAGGGGGDAGIVTPE